MASPGNQHCANCIGTLSFPIHTADGQTPRDESDLSADRPDGYRFLQTVIIISVLCVFRLLEVVAHTI